jgi:hypothetical protein
MGDGTPQNPYTREDVLQLIEKNGRTAKGLDLSGNWFENGIDLSERNLDGIILKGAVLIAAQLKGASLQDALKGTDLLPAHLEGANLFGADLEGAKLRGAHLEGVTLSYAKVSADTRLEGTRWGDYILGEERGRYYQEAVDSYRQLKQWYTNAGISETAAKFYYREKEANKKLLKWHSRHRWTLEILWLLFAYGEDWKRVFYWMAAFLILFAAAYYFWGKLEPLDALYFSAVSFTALGYGKWAVEPIGWVKGLGAFEAFVGVFMMALLLVTFVRKWTR